MDFIYRANGCKKEICSAETTAPEEFVEDLEVLERPFCEHIDLKSTKKETSRPLNIKKNSWERVWRIDARISASGRS